MLSERLQILLDPDRRKRLEYEAELRGTSVAALIRDAIDIVYPTTTTARREAAAAVLAAEAMDVPDVADLKRELDALRGRR